MHERVVEEHLTGVQQSDVATGRQSGTEPRAARVAELFGLSPEPAQPIAQRSRSGNQTPHTGIEWGRPSPSAVTSQKLRTASSRSSAHDHGRRPSGSSVTP